MFTSTGSSGLYKAPLSKSLLLVPSALSLLLALLLPHCQKLFVYDLHAVKNDFQPGTCVCSVCTILLLHTKSPSGTNSGSVVHHKQDIDLYIGTAAFHLWFLHLDCSHKWTYVRSVLRQQNVPGASGALHPQLDGKILFLDT
uniref:Isoform 5 of Ubiquitin-associated domain-containing protein 2 n=1 Tax=Homo sapiens TaxID=9606 RepID=Q8NBM4-5|nr:unnamed protein product [Homo sapiens]